MWGEDQYLKWLFFTPTTEVNICNKLSKLRLGSKISQKFVGHDKRRREYKSKGLKICGKGNPVPVST
jgi:hypothetical protein